MLFFFIPVYMMFHRTLSTPVMSTDVSQVGVTLPLFLNTFYHDVLIEHVYFSPLKPTGMSLQVKFEPIMQV